MTASRQTWFNNGRHRSRASSTTEMGDLGAYEHLLRIHAHDMCHLFHIVHNVFIFLLLHETSKKRGGRKRHGTTTYLGSEFFAEEGFEGLAVLGKLLDPFVELVKGHLVLEKGPAEFGLVVDEGNLVDGLDGWTRDRGRGVASKDAGWDGNGKGHNETHKRGSGRGRGRKKKRSAMMHVGQGSRTTHIEESYPPA